VESRNEGSVVAPELAGQRPCRPETVLRSGRLRAGWRRSGGRAGVTCVVNGRTYIFILGRAATALDIAAPGHCLSPRGRPAAKARSRPPKRGGARADRPQRRLDAGQLDAAALDQATKTGKLHGPARPRRAGFQVKHGRPGSRADLRQAAATTISIFRGGRDRPSSSACSTDEANGIADGGLLSVGNLRRSISRIVLRLRAGDRAVAAVRHLGLVSQAGR